LEIRIVIPTELWGKDMTIVLQSETHLEAVLEETIDDIEEPEFRKLDEDIIFAYDAIFTNDLVKHIKRTDSEARCYATPNDVRDALDLLCSSEYDRLPSAPKIGRVMKNKFVLKPGNRRNHGVPYYWEENKKTVEEWIEWIGN